MISKTHAKDLQARVKRGAKWLDQREPGWEKLVNSKALQMDMGKVCLLGQVYKREADKTGNSWTNGFDIGSDILEQDKAESKFPERFDGDIVAYYGFDESPQESDLSVEDYRQFWSILEEEWILAAKERLERGNLG